MCALLKNMQHTPIRRLIDFRFISFYVSARQFFCLSCYANVDVSTCKRIKRHSTEYINSKEQKHTLENCYTPTIHTVKLMLILFIGISWHQINTKMTHRTSTNFQLVCKTLNKSITNFPLYRSNSLPCLFHW